MSVTTVFVNAAICHLKCLHGLALLYLADDCVLASTDDGRLHLLSDDTMKHACVKD